MKVLILGDVHCYWDDLNITIGKALQDHPDITDIVQVGDFGYGWRDVQPFEFNPRFLSDEELALLEKIQCRWLDGNHEHHDKLDEDQGAWQPGWEYMRRGSTCSFGELTGMFFGGAASIDKASRTPHISWWPQEVITYGQVREALAAGHQGIDVVFSHEHPTTVPYSSTRYSSDFGKSDKDLLEVLRQSYQPDFWFFGHHHAGDRGRVGKMEWVCCPIIESRQYTIWTGNTIITSW